MRLSILQMNPDRHQRGQRQTMTAPPEDLGTMIGKMQTVRSTDDRVELIAKNIQVGRVAPAVHVFAAQSLTDRCGDKWCVQPRNWLGEVKQIANHIAANVRYTLDTYGIDTYRTPTRTIQLALGDCDDMAALGGAVLQAVGYPIRIKVIQMQGQPDFHHIYLMVGIPPEEPEPEQWIPFDPTQPQNPVGYEPAGIIDSRLYNVI